MKQYLTCSEKETKNLGEKLAQSRQGNILALIGELGAGKTTFVQGFAKGLGIKEKIISPTFVLIRQHQIPKTKKVLYHIDLYRLENIESLKQLGIEEICSYSNNIILIEWADKIEKILPADTLKISIAKIENTKRLIIIE